MWFCLGVVVTWSWWCRKWIQAQSVGQGCETGIGWGIEWVSLKTWMIFSYSPPVLLSWVLLCIKHLILSSEIQVWWGWQPKPCLEIKDIFYKNIVHIFYFLKVCFQRTQKISLNKEKITSYIIIVWTFYFNGKNKL